MEILVFQLFSAFLIFIFVAWFFQIIGAKFTMKRVILMLIGSAIWELVFIASLLVFYLVGENG
jgi:hypothetical protein